MKNLALNAGASTTANIIGWREFVALPQLGVSKIKVKIDTGARSSAIHAFNIEQFSADGKQMIRFQIHPEQRSNKATITAEVELLEYRKIRNSGGTAQLRPVIKTNVELGTHRWAIELSLTDREVMGFRMLLGRQAVRHKFLVDPGKSFLLSRHKG